ncbi:uncharacterized protein LOC144114847 [Amblyomma americanum]
MNAIFASGVRSSDSKEQPSPPRPRPNTPLFPSEFQWLASRGRPACGERPVCSWHPPAAAHCTHLHRQFRAVHCGGGSSRTRRWTSCLGRQGTQQTSLRHATGRMPNFQAHLLEHLNEAAEDRSQLTATMSDLATTVRDARRESARLHEQLVLAISFIVVLLQYQLWPPST